MLCASGLDLFNGQKKNHVAVIMRASLEVSKGAMVLWESLMNPGGWLLVKNLLAICRRLSMKVCLGEEEEDYISPTR